MKISGKCKAKDLIQAITEAWNKELKKYQIGEVWEFDKTDKEIIGRN